MKIFHRPPSTMALLMLLASTLQPTAASSPRRRLKDGSKGGVKGIKIEKRSLDRGPAKRECKFASKGQSVNFSCKSKAEQGTSSRSDGGIQDRGITIDPMEIRDKINYKVKASNKGVKVKIEYITSEEEIEDNDLGEFTETETEFELLFTEMIEYAKGDDGDVTVSREAQDQQTSTSEQAFDWENDIIVQTLPLSTWKDVTGVYDDQAGVISYFQVETNDTIALFNFTISRADYGDHVTANTMKIDVRIRNFPWTRNDTYLALLSTVKSKQRVEMKYDKKAVAAIGGLDDQDLDIRPTRRTFATDNSIKIDFEDATDAIGFVPFGTYEWAKLAEATRSSSNADGVIDVGNSNNMNVVETDNSTTAGNDSTANNTANAQEAEVVDTATIRVVGTSPPMMGNETFQWIAYSFVGSDAQGASEIYWDPEAGIGYRSGSAMINAIGSGVLMLLLSTFFSLM